MPAVVSLSRSQKLKSKAGRTAHTEGMHADRDSANNIDNQYQ
jgi:hypothetical protein